jgi:hypothetical protein
MGFEINDTCDLNEATVQGLIDQHLANSKPRSNDESEIEPFMEQSGPLEGWATSRTELHSVLPA